MERGNRSEMPQFERLPKPENKMDKKIHTPILREEKLVPSAMYQEGLGQSRNEREEKRKQKMYLIKGFADLYITNKIQKGEVLYAIVTRDLNLLKEKFAAVAAKKPDTADAVHKINDILLGDNPPWQDLDEMFEVETFPRLARKP